jgi:ATP-dependent DNA helicase Q1
MALSATCGPRVLKDLISILGLKEVVSGEGGELKYQFCDSKFFPVDAPPFGTVFFSSPLYRKNLHYRIFPKPDGTKDQYDAMTKYILDNHVNQTGIIYCLSKKVPIRTALLHHPAHILSGYGIRGYTAESAKWRAD